MTLLPPQFSFKPSQSCLPPPLTPLLISDTPESSADFALYSLLSSAIKTKSRVVLVDFQARGRAHWEAVGKKIGTALPNKASDQFIYIAPTSLNTETGASSLTSPGLFDDDTNEPTIANLWTSLLTSLDVTTQGDSSLPPKNGSVVFLVGLSELTYQGFSPSLIVKLWRGINSLAQSHPLHPISSFITHIHTPLFTYQSNLSTDELVALAGETHGNREVELLKQLIRVMSGSSSRALERPCGGIWWRVQEFKSGRSGVAHGEISIHALSPSSLNVQAPVPFSHPLQFRLGDTGVKIFSKGMGEGYL